MFRFPYLQEGYGSDFWKTIGALYWCSTSPQTNIWRGSWKCSEQCTFQPVFIARRVSSSQFYLKLRFDFFLDLSSRPGWHQTTTRNERIHPVWSWPDEQYHYTASGVFHSWSIPTTKGTKIHFTNTSYKDAIGSLKWMVLFSTVEWLHQLRSAARGADQYLRSREWDSLRNCRKGNALPGLLRRCFPVSKKQNK